MPGCVGRRCWVRLLGLSNKAPLMGWLKQGNVFSHSPGDQKSEIKLS